jgi:hypothetical protein
MRVLTPAFRAEGAIVLFCAASGQTDETDGIEVRGESRKAFLSGRTGSALDPGTAVLIN